MTPMMCMPILRQVCRTPEGPWWRRRLDWWTRPVVYELTCEFRLRALYKSDEEITLVLPAGFRSDLASTPRWTWMFGYRPDGRLLLPGLFHDFWYRHGFVPIRRGDETGRLAGDKSVADLFFRELALQIGCPCSPAWAAWLALRLFGGPAWRANAKYREAARQTGKLQLHGDYTDDHREPEEPTGE